MHDKYLVLPISLGKNKSNSLYFIVDKTWWRLQHWKRKFISNASKETLLKSIAQAIPVYLFSFFLLPKNICHKLESLFNSFWWRKIHSKGLTWCIWKLMWWLKALGGLGFRKLLLFNLAMLCKQAWRIIQQPSSVLARLFKARYFPSTDFFHADIERDPSTVWNSILASIYLLQEGMIWHVGNGSSIHVWQDPWHHIPHAPRIHTLPPARAEDIRVDKLIQHN